MFVVEYCQRKWWENDLPLSVTNHHLHRRCDYRKVEYEDMTKEQKEIIKALFLELAASLLDLRAAMRDILDSDDDVTISQDIQHVGYSQEACGYNK